MDLPASRYLDVDAGSSVEGTEMKEPARGHGGSL